MTKIEMLPFFQADETSEPARQLLQEVIEVYVTADNKLQKSGAIQKK